MLITVLVLGSSVLSLLVVRSIAGGRALVPLAVLVAVATVAWAPTARAEIGRSYGTLEVFGGWQNLQPNRQSVANAIAGHEGTAIFGGDLLLDFTPLGVGVSLDKTVSGTAEPWAGSVMAGFLADVAAIRIEVLGELGRRGIAFKNVFDDNGRTFVGVRPGVSVGLAAMPLRLGVSALIRWNTSGGEFSSPDYGFVGRVGVDF